jgi:hypothetical protein
LFFREHFTRGLFLCACGGSELNNLLFGESVFDLGSGVLRPAVDVLVFFFQWIRWVLVYNICFQAVVFQSFKHLRNYRLPSYFLFSHAFQRLKPFIPRAIGLKTIGHRNLSLGALNFNAAAAYQKLLWRYLAREKMKLKKLN